MKHFLTFFAAVLVFFTSFTATYAATTVPWTKNGTVEYPTYFSDLIGIGTTSPTSAFAVVDNSSSASTTFEVNTSGSTLTKIGGGVFSILQRANGTPTAKTVINSGQSLGELRGAGWDGTTYGVGGDITFTGDGTFSGTSHPTAIRFLTVASGSTSLTERGRWSSAGNFGIASSSPSVPLSVTGNAWITGDFSVGSSTTFASGLATGNPWNFIGNMDNFNALTIGNNSKTGNASADLVWANGDTTALSYYTDCGMNSNQYTNTTYPGFAAPNNYYCYNTDGPLSFYAASSTGPSYITFGTGGTGTSNERIRVTSTGNVGVGTTTPGVKLAVDGTISSGGSSNGNYQILNNAGALRGQFQSTGTAIDVGSYNSTFPVTLTVNGTEKARVTSTGAFGIGSSTPWGLLSVNPNGFTSGSPFFTIGSSTATQLIVDGTGLTSIGSSTTSAKLGIYLNAGESNTNAFIISSSTASAIANIFTVSNTGAVTTAGNTTIGGSLTVNGQTSNIAINATNASTNGQARVISARNSSAGTAAQEVVNLTNDNSGHTGMIGVNSTGFTPSGLLVPDSTFVTSNGGMTGGLVLGAVAAAPVILGSNNTEYARLTGAGLFGFGTTTPNATVQINGSMSLRRTATATNYAIATTTDYMIGVTSTAAARTVTLPFCSNTVNNITDGLHYKIKDESGGAATNNITLQPVVSQTIDGAASKLINTNYGSYEIYCVGASGTWYTVD